MNASEQMMRELDRLLGGKPIEDVAPLLVVAVARMLVIDAGGDMSKLALLVAKFTWHLADALNGMISDGDIGRLD